jgi:hypothetical protein
VRVTVLTSNQPRHIALLEAISAVADRVFAIQECNTIFPGQVDDFFRKSPVMRDYFSRVLDAERRQFGAARFPPANVSQLAIRMGDLSRLRTDVPAEALEADVFVVFGASYIRGPLAELLVERRAVNIHMGVSPFYRGSSTNFWALADGRPEYVGATIHRLTTGLDSGPILWHAFPAAEATEPFDLGMRAVQAAHDSLVAVIERGDLLSLEPVAQDRTLEVRYTRNRDFTDAVAGEYLDRLSTPAEIATALGSRDIGQFIRPVIGEASALQRVWAPAVAKAHSG